MKRFKVFFVIDYSVATSGECLFESEHQLDDPAVLRQHRTSIEQKIRNMLDQQGGPPGQVGIYQVDAA